MGIIDACLNGKLGYARKAYFFRADQYVRYDWKSDTVDSSSPQPLSVWKLSGKFANGIDACLNGEEAYEGKTYFFKGDQYVRYDWKSDTVDSGSPQPLAAWKLPGDFASRIDTALNGKGAYEGKAYFFKGDQYVRYDWATDKGDDGYPQPLSAWKLPGDFASGVDAALNGIGAYAGKAYFFKGDQYVRYDWATDLIDNGPVPIVGNWKGIERL